jgi:hypothetical protein
MSATIAECAENARECKCFASRTKDPGERKFYSAWPSVGGSSRQRKNAKSETLRDSLLRG